MSDDVDTIRRARETFDLWRHWVSNAQTFMFGDTGSLFEVAERLVAERDRWQRLHEARYDYAAKMEAERDALRARLQAVENEEKLWYELFHREMVRADKAEQALGGASGADVEEGRNV